MNNKLLSIGMQIFLFFDYKNLHINIFVYLNVDGDNFLFQKYYKIFQTYFNKSVDIQLKALYNI